jgi:hypothetical protein
MEVVAILALVGAGEALNRLRARRARRLDWVPEVVLFASPGGHRMDTKKFTVVGHFGKDRWADPASPDAERGLGEIVVMADHLARGGADVLETLLHEAAHAVADARGEVDVTPNSGYHNRLFAKNATELGLTVAQEGRHGWARTGLADGTADRFPGAIKTLDAAVIAAKAAKRNAAKPPRKGGPVKAVCGCKKPRVMRISPSVLAAAKITCEACERDFKEAPSKAAPAGGEGA